MVFLATMLGEALQLPRIANMLPSRLLEELWCHCERVLILLTVESELLFLSCGNKCSRFCHNFLFGDWKEATQKEAVSPEIDKLNEM